MPMRIVELIATAAEHLESRGFESARLEVEQLLGHVLGCSRLDLYLKFDRPVTEEELERFRELYRRRLNREPLQYLVGSAGFRDIEVQTDCRALVPRPETELLVEEAIHYLHGRGDVLVADLGAGSGAIAVSVAYELPSARVVAVDLSDDALMLTGENARRLGVDDHIELVSADMLAGLEGRGPFDAILSNPPYVQSGEIDTLQPEVRDWEPHMALDGGPDGLRLLETIAGGAHRHLKPGGLLLLECDDRQAKRLRDIITGSGKYGEVTIIRDLAGKKRLVRAVQTGA